MPELDFNGLYRETRKVITSAVADGLVEAGEHVRVLNDPVPDEIGPCVGLGGTQEPVHPENIAYANQAADAMIAAGAHPVDDDDETELLMFDEEDEDRPPTTVEYIATLTRQRDGARRGRQRLSITVRELRRERDALLESSRRCAVEMSSMQNRIDKAEKRAKEDRERGDHLKIRLNNEISQRQNVEGALRRTDNRVATLELIERQYAAIMEMLRGIDMGLPAGAMIDAASIKTFIDDKQSEIDSLMRRNRGARRENDALRAKLASYDRPNLPEAYDDLGVVLRELNLVPENAEINTHDVHAKIQAMVESLRAIKYVTDRLPE